jgi:hypothetical protein
MMKWNASQKKCATCDYWAGPRELVNYGAYVEIDSNDMGSCNCPGSTSRHLDNKQAQWTCPKWDKWGALK